MNVNDLLVHLLNGFFWGSLIALISIGLSLIYGILGIINLAHGELYMAGGVCLVLFTGWSDSFIIGTICSAIVMALFGLAVEKYVLRRVMTNNASVLIVTYGISICLQYTVLVFFGGAPRPVKDPIGVILQFGRLGYPLYRIVVIAVSLLAFTGLIIFLNKTRIGLWIKGTGENIRLAKSLGISTSKVYFLTFGVGASLAGIAGCMSAPIGGVDFTMGIDIIVLAFMSSVIGGVGNLKGTYLAGLLIGVADGGLLTFLDASLAKVSLLLLSCVILLLFPGGLFRSLSEARRV